MAVNLAAVSVSPSVLRARACPVCYVRPSPIGQAYPAVYRFCGYHTIVPSIVATILLVYRFCEYHSVVPSIVATILASLQVSRLDPAGLLLHCYAYLLVYRYCISIAMRPDRFTGYCLWL